MRNIFFIIIVFLFTGCISLTYYSNAGKFSSDAPDGYKYFSMEKNDSSYNLFLQYYFGDDTVYGIKLLINEETRSPYYIWKKEPNDQIKKILVIDIDTYKLIKIVKSNNNMELYKLNDLKKEHSRYNYYIFNITDNWIEDIKNDN